MNCPVCHRYSHIRKDFDFPDTMRVCEYCGCDFVVDEDEHVVEITFNPFEDV